MSQPATGSDPTVAGWQATLSGIASDFARVAADNLRRQTQQDQVEMRTAEAADSRNWMKWAAIGGGVIVALFVVKKMLK